jgi:hypothetical protein
MADRHWLRQAPENSLLLIAMMVAIMVASAPHHQACWSHRSLERTTLIEWQLPPSPDRSGDEIVIPTPITLPKINVGSGYDDLTFHADASEVVRTFIALHPVPELRNDLLEDIDSGRVKIVITSDDDEGIRFDANRGETNVRLLVNESVVVAISTNTATNVRTQAEIYYHFLVYENWKGGGSLNELNGIGSIADQNAGRTSRSICKEVWEVHSVAFEGYCNMLIHWGWTDDDRYCDYIETSEWTHAIFKSLLDEWSDSETETCLEYTASQAGHPRPNVYR